ncbi:Single-stranded DNA-binding protein, mitochondrial [Aphelenchoides besseyi]|nr:Single-stranded DNA-binding protein, mitochondrial [Aphelenchoides besseyi]KAI6226847.1 Single-stranded DNA-binding protein, mitochondrial [Aphelenchoides besseyi]
MFRSAAFLNRVRIASTTLARANLNAVQFRPLSISTVRFNDDAATKRDDHDVESLFDSGNDASGNYASGRKQPDGQNRRRRGAINLNRVELLGGVANDPVERTGRTGNPYCTFDMFTNVEYKRYDGSFEERVELHNILVFGGTANYVIKNIQRGTRVFVSGRLHYTGGNVGVAGQRLPRTACIVAELAQPIAKTHSSSEER